MLQFEDFQKLDRQNQIEKKIIIFGAGTIGRITQLALKKNNIEIDYFCDSDKRKQEYKLGNKLVLSSGIKCSKTAENIITSNFPISLGRSFGLGESINFIFSDL